MINKDAKGKNNDKPCNTIDTLIGAKTEIRGDISFSGGLRIDGVVHGNVIGASDGSSTLVLSEHAEVAGDVSVPHMILNGKIRGNVRCAGRIEMQAAAEIEGDVHYKVIEMALGASINGALVREAEESTPNNVAKLKPAKVEE